MFQEIQEELKGFLQLILGCPIPSLLPYSMGQGKSPRPVQVQSEGNQTPTLDIESSICFRKGKYDSGHLLLSTISDLQWTLDEQEIILCNKLLKFWGLFVTLA